MEPNSEFAALGALGLAGICRETLRVALSCPPGSAFLAGQVIMLTLSLLAHIAVSRALFSDSLASSSASAGLLRLDTNWAPFFLVEAACLLANMAQSIGAAAFCVFCVAPRYGVADGRDKRSVARDYRTVPWVLARFLWSVFGGNSHSATRLIRTARKVAWRLVVTTFDAFLLLLGYTALLGAVGWLAHRHLLDAAAPGEEGSGAQQLPRAALLLGGAAYLAGAAHIAAVWRLACLMLVVEDEWGFRGMHISDELLASKYWSAAAVFWTTGGCVFAVQLAFGALVVDDRMGLGVWFWVAAGITMAAALWAAVMAWLVAQVVVYFVCKSCHRRSESLDVTAAKKYLVNVGRGRATPTRKRRQ